MSENKHKLFLLVAFIIIFIGIIVWLIMRKPGGDRSRGIAGSVQDAITYLGETEPTFPDFLTPLPPFDELMGDHSSLPHGHISEDVGYSNIINPNWINDEGCNLFSLDIFDADCDGIPNWLEEYHETDPNDPENPYHQGAWNYDHDRVIHGMDGHYACDVYPTLLNCDLRVSSNNETIDHIQNTDGGCVPDVIEIVRGTNPLDGTDDHGPDVYGRTIPETRCSFGETTLNEVALSELPPVDLVDLTAPVLAEDQGYDLGDLTGNLSDLIGELDAGIGNLGNYTELSFDDNPINAWTFTGAEEVFTDASNIFGNHVNFLKDISGFAKDGFYSSGISDESFTVAAGGSSATYLCEQPGPMYIPHAWNPTPTTPQTLSVTLSDEAGNVSNPTIIENLTIDPSRWVIAIDRTASAQRLTATTTAKFDVFFNYPTSNVDVSDFNIRTSGTLEGEIASVVPSGTNIYTVTIDQLAGEGILGLDIALMNDIQGPADTSVLSPSFALVSRQTYLVDTITPEAPDVVAPASGETIGNPSRVVVNCQDAGNTIDVQAGGATASHTCQVPGLTFVPLPLISSSSPLDIELTETDLAGHTSSTTLIADVTFDTTIRPGVAITIPSGVADITNASQVSFDVLFTENVSGVDASDFTLVMTGTLDAFISNVVSVDQKRYTITVSNIQGNGLLSLFLSQSHNVTTISNTLLVDRGDTRARDLYRIDQDIPDPIAVVRPTTGSTTGNPTGIMVYCQSGWSSFGFNSVEFIEQEFQELASHTFAAYDNFTQQADFDPALDWNTRKNVKFTFDLGSSTWSQGLAQIRGWVDTNGLTIRPELRYTDVTNVSYADQFRAYCNNQAFTQANLEDGQGWIWDILFMIFNAGSYGRVPVYAYYYNTTTGALELDNDIQTPPGTSVPFVISVPFDDPNDVDANGNSTPIPVEDLLNPDGLYAFAIVDPNTHISIFDITLDIPIFGEVTIDIDFPIPDPTGLVASYIFTGPSCFEMFNSPTPILNLDLDKSNVVGGYNRL